MTSSLNDLVDLLDLEPIEVNIFRGKSPDENRQRVFGGQVAGQALVAAARTVDETDRQVHSLHAYFLRPGDPGKPILYEVDRLRDGRSFTTRRVVAIQHGKVIFNLQASFHTVEPGPDHQIKGPSGVPDPETLPYTFFVSIYKSLLDKGKALSTRIFADVEAYARESGCALMLTVPLPNMDPILVKHQFRKFEMPRERGRVRRVAEEGR